MLLGKLRSNLQVMSIPNTDLVEIHYRDPDPVQASVIAQAIVDQYLELDLRSRYEGTLRISNWLSGESASSRRIPRRRSAKSPNISGPIT